MLFALSNADASHSASCLRACACGIRAAGLANLILHWNFALFCYSIDIDYFKLYNVINKCTITIHTLLKGVK